MGGIRINAAAELLGVSQSTLRAWERRFGLPTPKRSAGGHRHYDLEEIERLRLALAQTGEISAAVALVRARGGGPPSELALRHALTAFNREAADRVLEESLALRTLERTVEEVLLAALAELERDGCEGPEYCFAWRYATGWLASLQRLAPPATREEGVLLLDGSNPFDLDSLYVQALELCLRRRGLRVLALPSSLPPGRLGAALKALSPQLLVLAGSGATLDQIARLVYAARRHRPGVIVVEYRGALPRTGASTVPSLPPRPTAAEQLLIEALEGRPAAGLARKAG